MSPAVYESPLDCSERNVRDALTDFRQAVSQLANSHDAFALYRRLNVLANAVTLVADDCGRAMDALDRQEGD